MTPEQIEQVLAEHEELWIGAGSGRCGCGAVVGEDREHPLTQTIEDVHRAHVAQVLASLMPQATETVGRAKVITLCGSTRFKSEFEVWNSRLTLDGNVVLSVGVFGHAYHPYHQERYLDPKKPMLDRLHLQKIDMADEVFVIDPGFYVGESTRREIEYARSTGKPVRFLSLEDRVCVECGRDNGNGTHSELERSGHLSHRFRPAPVPDDHPSTVASYAPVVGEWEAVGE